MKRRSATCLYCDKRATWPSKRVCEAKGYAHPRYCSQRHAALHALERTVDLFWCVGCGTWHDRDEQDEHMTLT